MVRARRIPKRSDCAEVEVKRPKRIVVELFNDETDGWYKHGLIDLDFGASYGETEQALCKIGIYMPRGSDTLEWGDVGLIREYGNKPVVRLFKRENYQ